MGRKDARKKAGKVPARLLGPLAQAVGSESLGRLPSARDQDPVRPSDDKPLTVGDWLSLHGAGPEEAGDILLASIRSSGARVRLPASDRDDVVAEVVSRAIAEDHAALRRAGPATPLGAWARGCVRMVSLEVFRSRRKEKEKEKEKELEKEKEKARGAEFVDPAPTPYQVAADRDELTFERAKVLEAALIFPRPYGHVLIWRLIEGLSWQRIRDRLNAHRPAGLIPISDRQAQHLVTESVKLLTGHLAGLDSRATHPQRLLRRKNSWIVATLPPLGPQIG